MTAGVGKMELVQMPEGSTYINESTQSRGDDECLPNVPLNALGSDYSDQRHEEEERSGKAEDDR